MILLPRSRIPFFSVVVCTYQRAHCLAEALDSLLAQSEPDWECVVVDDGSSDGTAELVRGYAASDDRFRYMWQSNRGTGLARNAGVAASSGLFVTFLDSDDTYAPEHLDIRKQVLVEYPGIVLLHGGCEVIGDPWVVDKDDPAKRVHLSECVIGGTFVLHRESLIAVGGFSDRRYADDAELYARLEQAGAMIARIDEPTYRYNRTSADSLCSTWAGNG